MIQNYDQKRDGYFANARVEIEPLLATRAARALEVGCGSGGTMHWLRKSGRVEQALGQSSCLNPLRPRLASILKRYWLATPKY